MQLKEVKGLEEQNDGNNVNLDQQMSEMAKNNAIFQAIQSSIKKDEQWFKEVIAASGKN
jgi:flagellar basal-body rod protein FlgB